MVQMPSSLVYCEASEGVKEGRQLTDLLVPAAVHYEFSTLFGDSVVLVLVVLTLCCSLACLFGL